MMDNIENYLFKSDGQHGLSKIVLSNSKLELNIAPWESNDNLKHYVFENCKLFNASQIADDELEFPLDIIAVDAKKIKGNRWSFCIHCDSMELNFTAEWPKDLLLSVKQ